MPKIDFIFSDGFIDPDDAIKVQEARKHSTLEMTSSGYVCLRDKITRKKVLLHRFILGLGKCDGKNLVDHINGIRHDNRKSNLRIVDRADNNAHRLTTRNGKYRNVYREYNKKLDGWNYIVQLHFKNKNYYGGRFLTKDEAAAVANELRKKIFGHLA